MAAMKLLPCLRMLHASPGSLPTGLRSFSSQCVRSLKHREIQRLSLNKNTSQWNLSQFNLIYVKQNPLLRRTLCTLRTVRDPVCRIAPQRIQLLLFRGRLEGPTTKQTEANKTGVIYISAIGIFMIGAAYAGVPLYRMFCQATGRGGQAVSGHDVSKVATMAPIKDRTLTVRFNADVASSMQWNFRPQQSEVRVLPGETALAFYTARNPTDKPIIGISTYNVVPFEAGAYFNKIQCFCFEEQRLNPHEQVDMPVFFYIDPDFAEDPKMDSVDQITLSYTFFESKEGLSLPLPGYQQPHAQPQAQA